jgi:hypothetical protein
MMRADLNKATELNETADLIEQQKIQSLQIVSRRVGLLE